MDMRKTIAATILVAVLGVPGRVVAACTGDCSVDGVVTVDEIIQGVNIALGSASLSQCSAFDADGGGGVTVDELVTAVNNALRGCSLFSPGRYSAIFALGFQSATVDFTVANDGSVDGLVTLLPEGSARPRQATPGSPITGSVDFNTGAFSITGVIPGSPPIVVDIQGTLPSAGGGGSISIRIGGQTFVGSFSTPPTPTPTSTPAGATHTVMVGQTNLPFDPELLEIDPGDTVTWTWVGGTHSVRSALPGSPGQPNCNPDGRFDSGPKSSGTFSYTFTTPGSYEYHCGVAGHCQNFESGIVIVRGTPTATWTATATRTPTPSSTATATATAEVVDGVATALLGTFSGTFTSQFGTSFPARLQITFSSFAQVLVTDLAAVLGVGGPLTLTAETPTRIRFLDPSPFNMRDLTLELVGPGHVTGTWVVGSTGMGTFTSTLDLMREP